MLLTYALPRGTVAASVSQVHYVIVLNLFLRQMQDEGCQRDSMSQDTHKI